MIYLARRCLVLIAVIFHLSNNTSTLFTWPRYSGTFLFQTFHLSFFSPEDIQTSQIRCLNIFFLNKVPSKIMFALFFSLRLEAREGIKIVTKATWSLPGEKFLPAFGIGQSP
jgi:hypothetical protein